jgi:hypothetical protein
MSGGMIATLAAVVGGGIVAVGCFLSWLINPSGVTGIEGGSIPNEFAAYDFLIGSATLVAAGAIVVLAMLWLASPRITGIASPLIVVGAIVILASSGFVYFTANERFVDIAASASANRQSTSADIRDFFPRFLASNDIAIEPGVGLYLTLGGGLLALLGGIMGIVRARRRGR